MYKSIFNAVVVAVVFGISSAGYGQNVSSKAKMAEVPRVIASFESAFLASGAERGISHITADHLIFEHPTDSKWFKYEFVIGASGNLVGYKATALSNIDNFAKGNFLQTTYRAQDETFTHCAGGSNAAEAFNAAKSLTPYFLGSGGGVCGGESAQSVASSEETARGAVSSFVDSRDGKSYKKVTIGTQTWMAENLNNEAAGGRCYGDNPSNCAKYGRLYNWDEAYNACPSGWHLPSSDKEWTTLVNYAGGKNIAGKKLKSKTGWNRNGNGTDEYGFSALPGGVATECEMCDLGETEFHGVGTNGSWWSATWGDYEYEYEAWYQAMGHNNTEASGGIASQSALLSVRCVQDEVQSVSPTYQTPATTPSVAIPATPSIQMTPEAYNNRGIAYANNGDYDRAIAEFNQVILMYPKNETAYNNRGNAYASKGDYDLAIADFNQAILLNPNNAEAYMNRGIAYSFSKIDVDQAIADCNQAIQLNSGLALAYNARAIAYALKRNYNQAIADFETYLQSNPNDFDATDRLTTAYYARGIAYFENGEHNLAFADFNQAIQRNPNNAEAYFSRGVAYFNKGDYANAIPDFEACFRLNPNHSDVNNALAEARRLNGINDAGDTPAVSPTVKSNGNKKGWSSQTWIYIVSGAMLALILFNSYVFQIFESK